MTAAVAARGKDTSDGQISTTYEATDKFLDAAADENWARLGYRDEEEREAFILFDDTMVLKDTANARQLQANWNNAEYLDAINKPLIEEVKKTGRKGRAAGSRRAAEAGGASRR
jgi:hypothetical protein